MTTAFLNRTVLPDEKEIAAAVESSRQLAAFLTTKFETRRIELVDETQRREVVELPTFALRLLGEILSELARGNAVKVVPIPVPQLLKRRFSEKERKALQKRLKGRINEIWTAADGGEWARTIHLADLARVLMSPEVSAE